MSPQVLEQISALRRHYRAKQRPEALRTLRDAIQTASRMIENGKGLPAPGPYPALAQPGYAWVLAGLYWFRYTTTIPAVILNVFYDTADIPGRI